MGDYAHVDTLDGATSGAPNYWKPPQPTYISVPEGIEATHIKLEMWTVCNPSQNYDSQGIAEIEVYTGSSRLSKLINYTDTEFIQRAMEINDNQNPIYRFDNGDGNHIEDVPSYYRSRPSQQGNFRVNIGVKSQSKNPAMRYNAYYTSVIDVSSNQSSYEYGNQPNPDPLDLLIKGIQENWVFFLLVIIVNIVVLQWISGGTSWAWVGSAVLTFDLAPIAIMAVELVLFGEVGGFTKTSLYHMIGFYQLYNIVMDWDSAIVRFCMLDFEAPFKVIFDY